MAHWAKINEYGIVENVIVTSNNEPDEGESWIKENLGGTWVKTSYNTKDNQHSLGGVPLRKNFAQVGFTYNAELDAFIPPKPLESWILDEENCIWIAPKNKPILSENQFCQWNEELLDWEIFDLETIPEQ